MSLIITTTYALPLIAIWFALWIGVTSSRPTYNASIGDAGKPDPGSWEIPKCDTVASDVDVNGICRRE